MNSLIIVRPDYYDTFAEIKQRNPSRILIEDSPLQFKKLLSERLYDLFVIDSIFSKGLSDPLYWVKLFKKKNPQSIIIILNESLGGDNSVLLAEADLVMGFRPKRLSTFKDALLRIEEIMNRSINKALRAQYLDTFPYLDSNFQKLKSKSVAMGPVFGFISEAHRDFSHIILSGEKGAGKYQIAKAIHLSTFERQMPFFNVSFDGGLVEDVIENHLHFFKLARKGTLYINNISGEALSGMHLGNYQNVIPQVRLIFGSEESTFTAIDGSLKLIKIPPLRDRKEDIPFIANQFIKKFARRYGSIVTLTKDQVEILKGRPWTGNLNELRSYVENLFFRQADLLEETSTVEVAEENLERLEEMTILKCLKKYEGNISTVAKKLGLGRSTLYRKMKKYGISID